MGHCNELFCLCVTAVRAVSPDKVEHISSGGAQILFVIKIEVASVWFGDIRIALLLFADELVLMASSDRDLPHTLRRRPWFSTRNGRLLPPG